MKKAIVLAMLMFVVVEVTFAGVWENTKKFQAYKATKAEAVKAEEAGNTTTAVAKYLEAASMANKGAIPVIEGWQYNNAAYVLIKLHKTTKEHSLLVEAMTYLTDAKAIVDELIKKAEGDKVEPNVEVLDLKNKVERNIDYCKTWLGI